MNKIVAALTAFLVAACANNEAPKGNLNITGSVEGLKSGSALVYLASNSDKYVDSVQLKDGVFNLNCNIDAPQQIFLYVKDTTDNMVFMSRVFTDKGEISIKGEPDYRKKPIISNAPLHDEWQSTLEYVKTLAAKKKMDSLSVIINKHYLAGDKVLVNELDLVRESCVESIIDSLFAHSKNAASNHVVAFIACEYGSSLPIEKQEALLQRFSVDFTNSHYLTEFKTEIEKEKKISAGCKAPDFKVNDLQGNEYTLASFAGKYIFLEFSASWCGWCKKEIPFVRDAYTTLKDKNIVFITMNMDTTRDKWEGDVTKENIEWLCLSNLQGMKSELAASYNIQGIPACYVIDPSGTIIKRDIRGKEVKEYLSGLFK